MLRSPRFSMTPRPLSSPSSLQAEVSPEGVLKTPQDSETVLVLVGKSPSPSRTPLQALGSPFS